MAKNVLIYSTAIRRGVFGEARRIAANIAKLPELSRAFSSGVNHKLT